MAGAQRHQPAPLPAQARTHDGRQQHHHPHQAQRQLRQQRHQSSAPQQHASNNLSVPPMSKQDHERSNLIAALSERVQLARMHQHHRLQQEARQAPRQTKSLEQQSPHERHQLLRANANRRASSSAWSPNHVLHEGRQAKFSRLQAEPAFKPRQSHDRPPPPSSEDGKLLICYYTTRQTAPYWPKDGREFVVPAARVDSIVAGSGADLLDPSLQQASSVNVGSFNDRYPNYQRPEAKHMHSKYSEPARAASAGGQQRQMILVSPRIAPFNRTQPSADLGHERHRSGNGPLMHLFFMSPASPTAGHHHHSISSRQDNLPTASTLVSTSGPTSAQNNGVLGGEQRQPRVSEAAYSFIGPTLPGGGRSGANLAGREPASGRGAAGGQADRINNGESDAANFVQMRNQHQSMDTPVAPSTSAAFIGSSSSSPVAPSSWTTSSARDANNVASPPTSPNVMSNNYYYYFNNNNQAGAPATTVSFPTSTRSTQDGLNTGNVNVQRAKSLQMAGSELSPALQLGVSAAPVAPSSASFSPIAGAAASAQQSVGAVMGLSTHAAPSQQHPHEQLLKNQAQQMVPVGHAGDEQKATTALMPSGPSSSMFAVSAAGAMGAATSRPIVLTADDLLIAGRQHQPDQQHHDSGSPSSSLATSPLSTVFDVFGAASQYLMRFKPSSLLSPSAFSSNFNTQTGQLTNLPDHQRQSASGLLPSAHQQKTNSSSLFSGAASSFISFPFSNGLLSGGGSQLAKSIDAPSSGSSERISNGTSSKAGFLSRLTFHSSNNQAQQQQQRREDICGRTIQTPERRIIGGEGAKYGEFPYQVHIKIAKHQCGGALVDRQSIVTAAHCVYHFITRAPVSKLQIVIGAYDIEDEQYQELPPQYFKVNKVKLHPNFRFSASHPDRYDIAILKLDKPVKYTDNVLPVCLPGRDLRFENMVGTVTGFGKTDPSLSNRYGTRLLQKVDVPIIENNECERWHRTRGIDLKIFPEMMCAGYEDGLKDACVGDSGGPLVIKTPVGSNGSFRWTLAGITSAGFGCAQSRQPGIYHRVSHTVDWILENLD